MTDQREAHRAGVENGLMRLRRHRMDMDLDRLRVRQAIERRPELRDLLAPVAESLERYSRDYDYLSSVLSRQWQEQQAQAWAGEMIDGR
jgi:hypothetical protein